MTRSDRRGTLSAVWRGEDISGMKLFNYQKDAILRLKKGSILCGGVGSGKSLTAIGWYYLMNGGGMETLDGGDYIPMFDPPKDLYIITTARKRDTFEWEKELAHFLISPHDETNLYSNKVVIDSWNNIGKYAGVQNACFIFDEQRVVGKGVWVKAFLKIAKVNDWILLSATPGDTWSDYIPVFIANGFYKNRSAFEREHVVYSRTTKFPKIEAYLSERKLMRLRDSILVDMDFHRETRQHHGDIFVEWDRKLYKHVMRSRWDIWKDEPIENAGGLCYALRKIVNSDPARGREVVSLAGVHKRLIIFYNFDYELDILKKLAYPKGTKVAEWNGHRHEPIPDGDRWVYLVQYSAGAEGWNCTATDAMIFYSQNYSYKVVAQACGRIDRLNTPYHDLYYYHLKSRSSIDLAIARSLRDKRTFNERRFVK